MNELWPPILLSLQCALVSVALNLPWGIFWGWVLARRDFRGKSLLQTALYLPLVLPPVLTGYFLLEIFSIHSPLGRWLQDSWNVRFVLDWKGAALAAAVVSSPFMIQMTRHSLQHIDSRLELAARNLGASFWKVAATITLPLCWRGLAAGMMLVFARSIAEFGATIIVAGNIPHKTQTIPLAIYGHVLMGREEAIWPLTAAAVIFAYAGLLASEMFHSEKKNCP